MKACIAFLPLFLAVLCVPGRAQTVTPSITIGTHVLTLGMPESSVLAQLGSDLELRPMGRSPSGSSWGISKKTGPIYQPMGSVYFDASHHLTSAMSNRETEDTSGKSLFYAIDEATQSLEHDGLTECQISAGNKTQTEDAPSGVGSGTLSTRVILMDCGVKQVRITLYLSDVPGETPTQIEVTEFLHRK